MPRVRLYQKSYMVQDAFDSLKYECMRYGLSQKEQGEICGIGAQAISNAYKRHTLTYEQVLLIRAELDKRKEHCQHVTK